MQNTKENKAASTMFKESFKYYKSKNPPPGLENVLDLSKSNKLLEQYQIKRVTIDCNAKKKMFGLKLPSTWEVYEIIERPGLLFIKNPFTSIGQRYWTIRCLQEYTKKPSKTNLDTLNLIPENKDWWTMCQNNSEVLLLNKLRWVTFGYHHNWDTKVYSEEDKCKFPKDLSDMTAYLASIFGYVNFNAEAAIVNYYHMDSTLSGHTDHSEHNLEAPLFSFSFGQTAIFLLGGKTKDDKPTPIFLRSGDVVIMSKESRLAYHGVPKILQIDSRYWEPIEENESIGVNKDYKAVVNICKDEDSWKPFGDYLSSSRININVRQVLSRGQKRVHNDELENI